MEYFALVKRLDPHIEEEVTLEMEVTIMSTQSIAIKL
ncbi:hypothetical protein ACVIJU_001592 [Aeribacillus sp. SP014]|jgi:hypothetical protein